MVQVRKPNNKGYQFILFNSFTVGDQTYMIIMNVDNYDPESETSLGSIKGDEEGILDLITNELKSHKEWFSDKGELRDRKNSFEVESVFYRHCKKIFQ